METIQAIRSRRSIRKYQPKPVPHEVIEQIVADAAYAPSWKNTQIARYVLVEDRTTIDKMAEEMVLDFKLNEKTLKNCPAVMVLTYVTGRSGYERDGSFSTPKEAGFEMFDAMIESIREDTVRLLFTIQIKNNEEPQRERVAQPMETQGDGSYQSEPRRVKKVGRNDPCPCGSGKKYKNCCGRDLK